MNTRSPKIITTKQEIKTTSNIGFFIRVKLAKMENKKNLFFFFYDAVYIFVQSFIFFNSTLYRPFSFQNTIYFISTLLRAFCIFLNTTTYSVTTVTQLSSIFIKFLKKWLISLLAFFGLQFTLYILNQSLIVLTSIIYRRR